MRVSTTILPSASLDSILNGTPYTLIPLNTNLSQSYQINTIVWKQDKASIAFALDGDMVFKYGAGGTIFPVYSTQSFGLGNPLPYTTTYQVPFLLNSSSLQLAFTGSYISIGDTTLQLDIYYETLDISDTAPPIEFDGNLKMSGSLAMTGSITMFSGSLIGTASWAQSASQAVTSSYVTTLRAAGSNSQVQYNNSGVLGASQRFQYAEATGILINAGAFTGSMFKITSSVYSSVYLGGNATDGGGLYDAENNTTVATFDGNTYEYSSGYYKYDSGSSAHVFVGALNLTGNQTIIGSSRITNGLTVTGSLNITGSVALVGDQRITGSILFASSSTDHNISGVDSILFDTIDHTPTVTGQLAWNVGDSTLELALSGSAGAVPTLRIGEQQIARVFNAQGTTITKGQVVYISGSQGNRIAVKLAAATSDPFSAGTLGFVLDDIANGAEGYVTTEGPIYGLNTSGLTAGAALFLSSSAGQYTQTRPVSPLHEVRLGFVERVHASAGSIYIKIDNGYELDELHDVLDNTTTSSFGDLLVRSGSVWTNSKQLTGSYGLTGSLTATSFTGSLLGTSSWAVSASRAIAADNGGVTSIIAGTGISVNQSTGAVTITNTTAYPPGGVTYDIQYNNGGVFGGNAFFQYDAVNNKVKFENANNPVTTPLTNANYNTIETYNSNNGLIPINNVDYQFTTAQFPYAKKILANVISASIIQIEANASGSDPGLLVHSFKCDYTLVGISGDDRRIIHTRCGTLYCSWDDDSATYPRPTITDTYNNSVGADVIKLDTQAVFSVALYNGVGTNSGIELQLNNNTNTKDIIFNGLFTIFSMK